MNVQRLMARRDASNVQALDDASILYFSLSDVLPEGHTLALDVNLSTLSYLYIDENTWPRLLVQRQFSRSEISLLRPLLENYPHYCPHEVMFASFYTGTATEKAVGRARQRLQEALEYNTWDHEMRPMRNVLSRVRSKLKGFGLDILSILETGYILMVGVRAKSGKENTPVKGNRTQE